MSISSTGVISGLDIRSIVSKLGDVQRAPLKQLQTAASATQAKISSLATLRSKMSALQDAASALRNPSTWNNVKVRSSNESAVSASGLNIAKAGSFTVDVTNVAKAQAMAAGTMFPAGAFWTPGTLTLQMGRWTVQPSSFEPKPGVAVNVSVTASDTSHSVAEKINSLQTEVRASVISDGKGGERLFLQGAKTGVDNGFRLTVQDSDGDNTDSNGLSAMVSGATMGQYAQNANITVDGISLSSSTNTFEDILGAKLTVNALGQSSVDLAADVDGQKEAVKKFVEAYNAANSYLNTLTAYDATTRKAGALQGDAMARSLQNGLRKLGSSAFTEQGAYRMGITIEKGGNLKFDESKFDNTDRAALKDLFMRAGSSVGERMQTLVGAGGAFDTQSATYSSILQRNQQQQTAVSERADKMEQSYMRQFQALDTRMAGMQAVAAYWNTQNSK